MIYDQKIQHKLKNAGIIIQDVRSFQKFIGSVMPKLFDYFGVNNKIKQPTFLIVKNIDRFARLLLGYEYTKDVDLVDIFEHTSLFYNDDTGQIIVPSLRRTGKNTIKSSETFTINGADIIHESIHYIQDNCNGLTDSFLFDEGFDELNSYILSGDIDPLDGHGYFNYVHYLIVLLSAIGLNGDAIADLAKRYILSNDMGEFANVWNIVSNDRFHDLRDFMLKLENASYEDGLELIANLSTRKHFAMLDEDQIRDILFELYEKHGVI